MTASPPFDAPELPEGPLPERARPTAQAGRDLLFRERRPLSGAGFAGHAAVSTGPVARRGLERSGQGRLLAVFGRVFYVEAPGGMLCIGTRAMEPGPLSVVTSAPVGLDWRETGLRPGMTVVVSRASLRMGHLHVVLAGAADWSPFPAPARPVRGAVASGFAALGAALPATADAGLGRFLRPGYAPGPCHRDCRAAAAPLAEARRWLGGRLRGATGSSGGWAAQLIGLGGGLTPSGDDVLGGAMIALHALGQGEVARQLWREVEEQARTGTNAISFTLMQAAAAGLGSDSLHRALAALLTGDPAALRAVLPAIDRIGHSSGWDALTGAVVALEAWIAATGPD